jgi:amino acid transporter
METTEPTAAQGEPLDEKRKLRRALGFWDLVLFYIAAIVGLRWVATASKVGPSAVSVWLIAFLFFFVPLAVTVIELSSRYPEEGGIYVWSKRAFGDFHAFMTGWTYWTSQLVYFPGLLFFAASNAAYVIPEYSYLATNKVYLAVFSLAGLTLALILNLVGLGVGKWMPNTSGSLGTWIPAGALIVMGVVAWLRFGPASDFSVSNLVPHVGSVYDIVFWANIAFAFGGLEAASVMGEEVRDAKRKIPKAIILAGAMITFIYVVGTVCLLLALPQEKTSGLVGIIDAIRVTAERVGGVEAGARVGSLVALLMSIGYIGAVGAWIAATARLPFVAGIDRYLPSAFGRVHPRWGTPHVALLVQAGITAVFIVLAHLAGEKAEQAYLILVSLGIISYFIPYLYLFLSVIVLQRQPAGADVMRVPGGRPGAYVAGGLGFGVTGLAIVLACIPGADVENKRTFFITVFGTIAATLVIGVVLYVIGWMRKSAITSGTS